MVPAVLLAITARQIKSLWEAALLDSRAKPVSSCIMIAADGETFHFSLGTGAGTTWSPEPGTKMADLVAVARQLAALAWATPSERARLESDLRKDIEALLARFARPDDADH